MMQFAVVRVTPVQLATLDKWGAFAFWAVVCAIGLVVLGLWAPETKGVPMERMGELFEQSWWRCGRAKLGDEHVMSEDSTIGNSISKNIVGSDEKGRLRLTEAIV